MSGNFMLQFNFSLSAIIRYTSTGELLFNKLNLMLLRLRIVPGMFTEYLVEQRLQRLIHTVPV